MGSDLDSLAAAFGPAVLADAVAAAAPQIEVLARSGVREHVATSTAPDGTPWAGLKFPRPAGGDKPLQSTGLLAAGVTAKLEPGGELVFRANAPGARLQQFGGIVVPVNAKVLAIPLTREAARVGSPRRFPRALIALAGGLYERAGKGAKLVRQYLFAKQVTVVARPFLGVSAATAGRIGMAVAAKVPGVIARRIGGRP